MLRRGRGLGLPAQAWLRRGSGCGSSSSPHTAAPQRGGRRGSGRASHRAAALRAPAGRRGPGDPCPELIAGYLGRGQQLGRRRVTGNDGPLLPFPQGATGKAQPGQSVPATATASERRRSGPGTAPDLRRAPVWAGLGRVRPQTLREEQAQSPPPELGRSLPHRKAGSQAAVLAAPPPAWASGSDPRPSFPGLFLRFFSAQPEPAGR